MSKGQSRIAAMETGCQTSGFPPRIIAVLSFLTFLVALPRHGSCADYVGWLTLDNPYSTEMNYGFPPIDSHESEWGEHTSSFTYQSDGSSMLTIARIDNHASEGPCDPVFGQGGRYTFNWSQVWEPVEVSGGSVTPQFLSDGTYVLQFSGVSGEFPVSVLLHQWGTNCIDGDYDTTSIVQTTIQDNTRGFYDSGQQFKPHEGTAHSVVLEGSDSFPSGHELSWRLIKATCGNGTPDPDEACDDGNNQDGDGCSADCYDECAGLNEPVLHAGDRVTVTVRMDTSNRTEDQGNVSLQLISRTTGEPMHLAVTEFGVTQQFTYVNTHEGDRVVARWNGNRNGNESCVLTVGTLGEHNPFTYESKANAYFASAAAIPAAAVSVAAIAVCSIPPVALECYGVGLGQTATGIAATSLATVFMQDEVASDPPDPNFSEIWVPVLPAPLLPGFPIPTDGSVNAEVAQALNVWGPVASELASYSVAAQRTIQRLAGAYGAGDDYWVEQQSSALGTYVRRIAELESIDVDGLLRVRETLRASGLQLAVSDADIETAMQQIQNGGLGAGIEQWLIALGAPQSAIDSAIASMRASDNSAAVGSLPDSLIRQNMLDARHAFVTQLTAPAPFVCYKAKPTASSTFDGATQRVADRFDVATFKLKNSSTVCNVAGFDNVDDQLTAPFDDSRHLVGHRVKRSVRIRPVPGIGTTHVIRNSFQSGIHLTLRKESHVLVASAATMGDQGTTSQAGALLDDFKCYKVSSSDAPRYLNGDGVIEDIRDQATEQSLIVGKPRYLCIPASFEESEPVTRVGAFTCYDAKPCRTCAKGRFDARGALQSVANNVTGEAVLQIRRVTALCIPSVLDAPTLP